MARLVLLFVGRLVKGGQWESSIALILKSTKALSEDKSENRLQVTHKKETSMQVSQLSEWFVQSWYMKEYEKKQTMSTMAAL